MANTSKSVSGIAWFLTLSTIYLIGVLIAVSTLFTSKEMSSVLIGERTSNAEFALFLDKEAWENTSKVHPFSSSAEVVASKYLAAKPIIQGKEFVLEKTLKQAPESILLYGKLLDYRLTVMLALLPSAVILILVAVFDAGIQRRISAYRNSFTSPLRHQLGSKMLGLGVGTAGIGLFFLPYAVPIWLLASLFIIKATGWWLWTANLPKRV